MSLAWANYKNRGEYMKLKNFLAFSFLALPIYAFAHFTGTYEVSGFNPFTNSHYTGQVVITKNDDHVYTATWTFDGGGSDVGTGVRKGDDLAFVFEEGSSGVFGVQLYDFDGHHAKGPWTFFGGTAEGHEKLKKID